MAEELADVFGEDLAQHVKEKTAERREERNRITEEQLKKICAVAVNEGKFEEGEPQFSHTTENGITHTVMLVQVPDPDRGEVWEHLSEPWEGAARLPLEYLGEWYWSTFPRKEEVAKLDQGDYAIVVGDVEENEGDNGEVYYNIYPVRGLATLPEAKKAAQKALEDEGFASEDTSSEEEEEEEEDDSPSESEDSGLDFSDDSPDDGNDDEDEEESSSSSSSSGGGLKGMLNDADEEDSDDEDEEEEEEEVQEQEEDDEEEPVPYEEIAHLVENLADNQDDDEEPQVFEIEEGSSHHERLTQLAMDRLELDNEEATASVIIDVIQGNQGEEEEDDEEDGDLNTLF